MARIALDHVEKVYGGGVKALDDLNLEVTDGGTRESVSNFTGRQGRREGSR